MRPTTYLYVITEDGQNHPVKVGIAADVGARRSALQAGNHRLLAIKATFRLDSPRIAYTIETHVHRRFSGASVRGEWLAIDVETAVKYIAECVPGTRTDAWVRPPIGGQAPEMADNQPIQEPV